jgi:hypothetical protein
MIASKKKFLIYVLLLVVVVVFFLVWYFSRFYEGADGDANTNSDATTDDSDATAANNKVDYSDATTDDSDATAANNKVDYSDATTDNNDATAANNKVDSSVATPVVNSVATAAANPKLSKIDADYRDISNATVKEIRLGGVVTANQSEEVTYTANDGSTQTGNYTLTTIDGRQAGNGDNLKVGNPRTGDLENKSNNVYTWEQLRNGHAKWQNDHFNVQCNKIEDKNYDNPNMVSCLKYRNGSTQFESDLKVYKNSDSDSSYSFKYEDGYIQDQLIHNE